MESSKIFAFVPSYNHAPFIAQCLKSVIKQTLQPAKLLVTDDGSSDDSPKIIEKILKQCPFDCELIVRENRGICSTLNEALEKSKSEYFAYLGSDDVWLEDFLAHRLKVLERRKRAALVYGHAFLINEKNEIFDSTEEHREIGETYADGDARKMLLQGIAPVSSTVIYRRSFLEKFGWNSESYLEDYELYLKLSGVAEFAFDSQVLSCWRQHGSNTSRDKAKLSAEVIAAQERNFAALGLSRKEFEKIRMQTEFRFARQFLQQGDKREAAKKALKNWRGANAKSELLNFGLRFLVPMQIVNKKRKMRQERYLLETAKTKFDSE